MGVKSPHAFQPSHDGVQSFRQKLDPLHTKTPYEHKALSTKESTKENTVIVRRIVVTDLLTSGSWHDKPLFHEKSASLISGIERNRQVCVSVLLVFTLDPLMSLNYSYHGCLLFFVYQHLFFPYQKKQDIL